MRSVLWIGLFYICITHICKLNILSKIKYFLSQDFSKC